MKRIISILAALAICSSAFAQFNFTNPDNLRERYRFGNNPTWEKGVNIDIVFPMYFGASTLIGGQYSGDWNGYRSLYGDFMETAPGFTFAMDLARVNLTLTGNFQLYAGVRYTSELYSMRNRQIYLDNNTSGKLAPYKSTDFGRSSHFGIRTWGVPVGFSVGFGRFIISANAAPEWTSRALSRYRGDRIRYNNNNLDGFSNFRMSYMLMAAYGGTGLFVRYSNTPLFKNGTGYDGARSLSFGVAIGI